jgi:hypothetical protein
MFAGRQGFKVAAACLFLAGSVLAPVAGAAEFGCQTPHDTQPTRTFDVQVKVLADEYTLGDTAQFRVKVIRELDGEALGPVENAQVGVSVSLGDVVLAGGAVTNADGKASVGVELKRYAPTGLADVRAYAQKETVDLPCHSDLEREYGDVEQRRLFKVVR